MRHKIRGLSDGVFLLVLVFQQEMEWLLRTVEGCFQGRFGLRMGVLTSWWRWSNASFTKLGV